MIVYSRRRNAEVAEPADALDSKSSGLNTRVGSTPTFCTLKNPKVQQICYLRVLFFELFIILPK